MMMHNGFSWWIYSDESLPTTFAWSFPTHLSNSSLLCISIIQTCLSEVCFPVLGKVTSTKQKGYLDYWDASPYPSTSSSSFPGFSLLPMFYPHGFTVCPGCAPELLVLLHTPSFPLLSSPHPLSLCLVCLPSQLLSKKRGLFRIHAGRKQRYPRQWACARGTLKSQQSITP